MPRRERYRQLLSVARSIVNRGGVDALTMSALTEEAGVSRPVVYEHFENSEAIAIALIDDYFETMIDLVDERTKDSETLDEYLTRAIEAQFEYHRGDGLLVRNLTNGHATGEGLNAAYLRLQKGTTETFEDLLTQQEVPADVARVAGFGLGELYVNVIYEFASRADSECAKETLKQMALAIIHALVPASVAKPATPSKVLQASREFKRLRGE